MKGDHIIIWHGPPPEDNLLGFWHHGIDAGDGTVIHYSGLDNKKTIINGAILRTPRAAFVVTGNEKDVHVIEYPPPGNTEDGRLVYEPDEVVRRAESKLGHNRYNLMWDNCESFARWCKTGEQVSHQTRGALIGGAAGVAAMMTGASFLGAAFTAFVACKLWEQWQNRASTRRSATEVDADSSRMFIQPRSAVGSDHSLPSQAPEQARALHPA